jgi:hypothetical protein
MALLATIPTVERGGEMAPSRDPSHVTRRSREWWLDVFRRAGWRQDPLHRVAERVLQGHPLPRKMGWEIFLFAPGPAPVPSAEPDDAPAAEARVPALACS